MFKKVADGWIRTRVLWYGRRPIWQMRHKHCPEMIKWLLIKTGLAYLPKVTMFYMIGPTRRRRWPANNKKIRSIFLTFSAFFVTLFASFFVTPDALERETDKATLSLFLSKCVSPGVFHPNFFVFFVREMLFPGMRQASSYLFRSFVCFVWIFQLLISTQLTYFVLPRLPWRSVTTLGDFWKS